MNEVLGGLIQGRNGVHDINDECLMSRWSENDANRSIINEVKYTKGRWCRMFNFGYMSFMFRRLVLIRMSRTGNQNVSRRM